VWRANVYVVVSWLKVFPGALPLPYLLDNRPGARGTLIAAKSRRVHASLKCEESVSAEHYLIFVIVVEDCLARVVVADLRSKK
jgi:hypothetical protein